MYVYTKMTSSLNNVSKKPYGSRAQNTVQVSFEICFKCEAYTDSVNVGTVPDCWRPIHTGSCGPRLLITVPSLWTVRPTSEGFHAPVCLALSMESYVGLHAMPCPFVDCMRRCELVCDSLQLVAGGGPLNTYVIHSIWPTAAGTQTRCKVKGRGVLLWRCSWDKSEHNRHWQKSISQVSQSINQSNFVGGLRRESCYVHRRQCALVDVQQVRKRLPEQVCLAEETKCDGQWFCWCHLFLEVIPSLWAGNRKSSATNSWQSACW